MRQRDLEVRVEATTSPPDRRGYTIKGLAEALHISHKEAKGLMNRLPQEHLDRLGPTRQGARIAPLWLLRRELSAFRDGPDQDQP